MTSDEEHQFNLFGCVSRCIIKSSEFARKPISRDSFLKRFENLFPLNRLGLLNVDGFCIAVKELNLCSSVAAVRNLEAVRPYLNSEAWRCFVLTDTLPNQTENLFHCRLALGIGYQKTNPNEEVLLLFHPDQSGEDFDIVEPIESLGSQFYHFLIAQS